MAVRISVKVSYKEYFEAILGFGFHFLGMYASTLGSRNFLIENGKYF
jgi:hypothetical protein